MTQITLARALAKRSDIGPSACAFDFAQTNGKGRLPEGGRPFPLDLNSYFVVSAALPRCAWYFRSNLSTRPAVSISFCFPVKNGWQLEQISTRMSLLLVVRVRN